MSRVVKSKNVEMSVAEKLKQTKAFVNMCLAVLEEEHKTPAGIAEAVGLSVSTIYRLGMGSFTLAIRWSTVSALGQSCGLELRRTKNSMTVKLLN